MDPVTLHAALRRRPFRPFFVTTTDGTRHEVPAGGDALLTATDLVVGEGRRRRGIARSLHLIPLHRIAALDWVGEEPAGNDLPPTSVHAVEPPMNPEIMQELLRAVPFRPFRVFVSDGSQHDVRHPELMYVTHRWIAVALSADRRGIPRETVLLNPLHITRIEPLPDGADTDSKQAG